MTTTPAVPSVPLPKGAKYARSFEYGLDIDVNFHTDPNNPVWQPVRRMSGLAPNVDPKVADISSYDDFGSTASDKGGETWGAGFSILVALVGGNFLPEAAVLDACTRPEALGSEALAHVRYYHKPYSGTPNPTDAYEGYAMVKIARAQTGNDGAPETWTVTLTGNGPRKSIPNPFTGWDVDGTLEVTGVEPTGAPAGDLVTITGKGMRTVNEVAFGAAVSAQFVIVSDAMLIAEVPDGEAGPADVIVSTSAGAASAPYPYTRG